MAKLLHVRINVNVIKLPMHFKLSDLEVLISWTHLHSERHAQYFDSFFVLGQ